MINKMAQQLAIVILVAALLVSGTVSRAETRQLATESRVKSGTDVDFSFELPAIPAGQQVRLATDARVDWPDLGGSSYYMTVEVNGTKLRGPSLINRGVDFTYRNAMDMGWAQGDTWNVFYSSDFSDRIRTAPAEWTIDVEQPFHYVWDITPLVKPGANQVRIHHVPLLPQGTTLVLRDVKVETGEPIPPFSQTSIRPAPTGTLTDYVPRGARKVPMDVEVGANGRMRLTVAGRTFEVTSRTSEPAGQWTPATTAVAKWQRVSGRSGRTGWSGTGWSGNGYRVERRVTVERDHIHIGDKITNTSKELVGVIVEHRLALAEKPEEILLCGRPVVGDTQMREQPSHPTALARLANFSIGLAAEDDVFRVHSQAFTEPGAIGLADPHLGIAPGQSHTLEWDIYPVPEGDYWDFINALRRNWGSNFQIIGPGTFDFTGASTDRPQDEQCEWINQRNLAIAISGQGEFTAEEVKNTPSLAADPYLPNLKPGVYIAAEGSAGRMAKQWGNLIKRWAAKNHACAPNVKSLVYLHPTIGNEPGSEKKYADARALNAKGEHLTTIFQYPLYLYLPMLNGSYGNALMDTVKHIVNDLGADGIYMDEFAYSSLQTNPYLYNVPWDGASVIIDPKTHAVTAKPSHQWLLQQSWRGAMVKYLRDHGKFIVGNGAPYTRTMQNWKLQMFAETVSYSTLIESHLGCPWGLGNHNTDYTDRGFIEQARRCLDYGGLYTVYVWPDFKPDPAQPHFTSLMYPTTPVELRAGMVIGAERIVTDRSGRFGWPDGSAATVYVYDAAAKLVKGANVKEVREGGKRSYEVRMPSDHLAILVRTTER